MRFSNSNVQLPPLDCNGYVIGRRTESDRTADGNRSGGGRKPIGQRTESDWVADGNKGVHLSQVHQQSNIDTPLVLLVQLLLARLVHLRQVHPLKKTLRNRNNIAAGHTVRSEGYTLLYILYSRLVHPLKEHSCLVGALETSAPPESTP